MLSRKVPFFIFCIALLWAVGIRSWHAGEIEPINPDEAMYLRQARFISGVVGHALGQPGQVLDENATGMWRYVRKDDWYSKPCWGHTVTVASLHLFGVPLENAGLAVSIVASLLCMLVLVGVGVRLWGRQAGLFAGITLALSYYWLLYSRSFWAETDSVLFVLLAVWSLLKVTASRRAEFLSVLMAGILAGIAVLFHYRLLYVAPMLTIVAWISATRNRVVRCAGFALGFCLVIGMTDLSLRAVSSRFGAGMPFSGLIGALFERYGGGAGQGTQTALQPMNAIAYLWYQLRYQGVVLLLAAAIGWYAVVRQQTARAFTPLICIVLPLIVLCCQEWIVARAGSLMIPFFCLLAGKGMAWALARLPERRQMLTACLLILVVFIENSVGAIRAVKCSYGLRESAAALQSSGECTVSCDSGTQQLFGLYAPQHTYIGLRELEQLKSRSNVCVIFSPMRYHKYPEQITREQKREADVVQRGAHVASVPHMTTLWPEFLRDGTQAHTLPAQWRSHAVVEPSDITTVRLYMVDPSR